MVDWDTGPSAFLQPFLEKLGHKKRRQMCPLYVSGLVGPGDRKSIEPMAERFAPGQYDRLHHFICDGLWDGACAAGAQDRWRIRCISVDR